MILPNEKNGVIHSIAVAVADVYGTKYFNSWHQCKVREINKIAEFDDDKLYALYQGYQRMNKLMRKYNEDKDGLGY